MPRSKKPDVVVSRLSSIVVLNPQNDKSRRWLKKNTNTQSWQWSHVGLAVDQRFAQPILESLRSLGFNLETK